VESAFGKGGLAGRFCLCLKSGRRLGKRTSRAASRMPSLAARGPLALMRACLPVGNWGYRWVGWLGWTTSHPFANAHGRVCVKRLGSEELPQANKRRAPGGIISLRGERHHLGIPGRHHPVIDERLRRNRQSGARPRRAGISLQ